MSQIERIEGASIINEILENAVQQKHKKIVNSGWLPALEFEPQKINSESYMLVVSLLKGQLDLGFSKHDLEDISKDSYARKDAEKYLGTLVSIL